MEGEKKRYLFLMKTNTWGGAERRMASYCASIDHNACSVTWVVLKDVFSAWFKAQGMPVNVIELPAENSQRGLLEKLYAFYRLVRAQRPGVVIASNFWLTSISAWEMMIASAVTGGNVYMVAHDCPLVPIRYPSKVHFGLIPGIGFSWWMNRFKMGLLTRVPRRTLAVCDRVKQHLVRNFGFTPEKIANLRFGVDLECFKPSPSVRREVRGRFGIGERDTVVVSTARLHKRKRLERLLEAFAVCSRDRDDLWLFIAGEGEEYGNLFALARSFKERIQKRIIFTGFVADVAPLMQASDIFVLCSDTDAFANASLEAMACGLAPVITKCIGPEEYIMDGINGFLVENSTRGVIDGLRKAAELGDAERNAISERARDYVAKNFDRAAGINEFLSLVGIPHLLAGTTIAPAVPETPPPLDTQIQPKVT